MYKGQSLILGTFSGRTYMFAWLKFLFRHQLNAYIFFLLQDFRTPKPAVLCSLRAKSWNIEVHKIGHSAGDNDNLSGASPISDGFQSQLVAPNSLYKCKTRFCSPPDFSYHKVIQISYVKLIDDVSHWQQFSMQVLSKKGWFVYLCSFVLREQ